MSKSDIALIGLGVMGENLVLNMESKGFHVSVYNRSTLKVDLFINGRAADKNISGAYSLEELIEQLKRPRKVMLMVKAGRPVDDLIDALIPLLDEGDIIIDGGNSLCQDTMRRTDHVENMGVHYMGMGISGGEEGALNGPALMPGGSEEAWDLVKDIFQTISARVEMGEPTCQLLSPGGSGHFVKMVHNGIEYGDMQLIAEAYHLMKDMIGLNNEEIHQAFLEWNKTELASYLIEITADIFAYKEADGSYLIDNILDSAGQKGTGAWSASTALDEAVPLTLITEAVYSRFLSALKEERVAASQVLEGPDLGCHGEKDEMLADLKHALFASKIISYAQGFALLKAGAEKYGWTLNYGEIAHNWRSGCIIRSSFLEAINQAYEKNPNLANLMLDDYFKEKLHEAQTAWRRILAAAIVHGITTPAMSSALNYYDGYRTERLPANLLQALRDYFGAHTYERNDRPRGEFFHTEWTEGTAAGVCPLPK
ncbi:MAG: decarboxylating NADP(+)-dependent phosphogluconate dehydrogenase [Saccharofermentanales bacterium]|nr:decarboxylating NADP(+)-dependent phosphogluconate dehydrogenase [Eubacteriales bacterium]MDD3611125.1 decarboxylating NADP(+)-dependent phosphogluconate dehydrogenase [Eubacteriales bacterium]